MPLSSEILPLVGVCVGALVAWGKDAASARTRYQREQASFLQTQRLSAYSAFSSATKSYIGLLYRVGAHRGVDDQTEPLSLAEAMPLLVAAFHERESAFERMRMIGSDEIVAAARTWVRALYAMRRQVEAHELDRSSWESFVTAANQGRDAFYQIARRDLNM